VYIRHHARVQSPSASVRTRGTAHLQSNGVTMGHYYEDESIPANKADDSNKSGLRKTRYEYLPLDPEQRQTRLLTISPGLFHEEIECRLNNVVLRSPDEEQQNALEYDAISYVWGNGQPDSEILINGSSFKVSRNVHSALQHLRLPETPRKIWIDGICIDQNSPRERGHQVQNMGLIYSQATSVIVWLGVESPTSRIAFDFIPYVQQNKSKYWRDYSRKLGTSSTFTSDAAQNLDIYAHQKWCRRNKALAYAITDPVEGLLADPWFQRLWIVQEAVLAKQLTVQCGRRTESWTDFWGAAENFAPKKPPDASDAEKSLRWKQFSSASFVNEIRRRFSIRRGNQQKRSNSAVPSLCPIHLLVVPLLLRCRNRLASDDRDKIYALLALTSASPTSILSRENRTPFLPDYTIPLVDVFMNFTFWCIQR
jgi:Heterokaryon incompatibility protein (HET)